MNRGVVEAHRQGIVTSASLMVQKPASEEAARLARECPDISVGLHACLDDGPLEAQIARFMELMERPPTHLDSHHHVHTRSELRRRYQEAAEVLEVPLRDCSGVRYCSRFYGSEQVTVDALVEILSADVGDGITELGCHPGRADPGLVSSYTIERELELSTLCEDRVRGFLDERGITLISFDEVPALLRIST